MVPEGYFAVISKAKHASFFSVGFPDHPGVLTHGKTAVEAIVHAREALSAALESDFEKGFVLPESPRPKPSRGKRIVFIRLMPSVWIAYFLRYWREKAGLTQKDLASRLGISYQAYQRMERPGRSNVTVDTLDRIAVALGNDLILGMKPVRHAG